MAITNDSSNLELCFGTMLFNDIIFNKNKINDKSILGKAKISENKSIYNNYYLKIVSQLFVQTKWQELFGLNILETMNLEYSQYIYLKRLLEEYERKYNISAKKQFSKLNRKQKLITKQSKEIGS